ncbi:MAG: PAS domain S-box protein, partial [Gemmatimonadota bacterium]
EPIDRFHWSYHAHPDDVPELARRFGRVLAGSSEEYEVRLRGPDGGHSVVRGVVVPVRDGDDVVGIFGVGLDVTEEEAAQRELEVQRRYFADLFEGSPEGIVLLEAETDRVLRVNEEFLRLFGYESDEVRGANLNDLIVPPELDREGHELNRAARTGGLVRAETVRRRKDGSLVEVSVLARRLDIPGKAPELYGIYRDISDRKETERALREREEELRHAQRLEAVGKLAGGVAHDFNNLLTVINGHARFALEQTDGDGPIVHDLMEIEKAGTRAAALTQQLLAYSRRQILNPQRLDPNVVVRELQGMLRRLIGEHIRVRTALTDEDVRVHVDRGQLEQVLINLVVNARDAMPDGGTLTLRTGILTLPSGDRRVRLWGVEPGTYIRLQVADTGAGMDGDTLDRAFEPFFTTKPQGKGTGLGLSTVFGIVKQSGGHIILESEPGAGTTCEVLLPVTGPAAHDCADSAPDPDEPSARGTILVVEDEDAVRELTVKILERDGCEVLAADGGARTEPWRGEP